MKDIRKMKHAIMWMAAVAGVLNPATGRAQERPAQSVPAPYRSLEDQRQIEAEGAGLLEQARADLVAGEQDSSSMALSHIRSSYAGDPAPLLGKLWAELSSEQRSGQAAYFLLMGVHRSESIAALRAIVRDRSIGDRGQGDYEHPPWNPRVEAARTLGQCGAKEAADDIWALYQERGGKDQDLPMLLAKLGDDRPRSLVAKVTLDREGYVENVNLVAHYRITDAVEPLKQVVAHEKALPQPSFRLAEAEAALFQITRDPAYLHAMFQDVTSGDYEPLAATHTPEAEIYLQKAAVDQGSNYQRLAFLELALHYPGDPLVKKIVTDSLEQKILPRSIDSETLMRVATLLHDPNIDARGLEYYQATGDRNWLRAYNRRDQAPVEHTYDY